MPEQGFRSTFLILDVCFDFIAECFLTTMIICILGGSNLYFRVPRHKIRFLGSVKMVVTIRWGLYYGKNMHLSISWNIG